MTRENEYTIRSRVRFSEIDHTRKITIPGIINYFQDCSIFQSEEIGYGLEYLNKRKKAWMLSAWQIVINRYPQLGEEITVSTWACGFKGICGDRNFCMRDEAGEITAFANSLWVYMDLQKGRPAKPGADEMEAYGVSKPLRMESAPRKIDIPEKMTELQPFPVRRYHIDTNQHVNNCQYVQMAKEVYEGEEPIKQVRAEYKKSAVYNDMIIPRTGREDNRTVVELCSVKGQTFATVEFRT